MAIQVKRYGKTRLYDAAGLRYVTVDTLRAWMVAKCAFTVVDAETGEDITRVLLG